MAQNWFIIEEIATSKNNQNMITTLSQYHHFITSAIIIPMQQIFHQLANLGNSLQHDSSFHQWCPRRSLKTRNTSEKRKHINSMIRTKRAAATSKNARRVRRAIMSFILFFKIWECNLIQNYNTATAATYFDGASVLHVHSINNLKRGNKQTIKWFKSWWNPSKYFTHLCFQIWKTCNQQKSHSTKTWSEHNHYIKIMKILITRLVFDFALKVSLRSTCLRRLFAHGVG